jgi:hypothetical protein
VLQNKYRTKFVICVQSLVGKKGGEGCAGGREVQCGGDAGMRRRVGKGKKDLSPVGPVGVDVIVNVSVRSEGSLGVDGTIWQCGMCPVWGPYSGWGAS